MEKVFAYDAKENKEIFETDLTIPADSFLLTSQYDQYLKFHPYRFPFNPRTDLQPDSVIKWNPNSYHAYMLAGDYYYEHNMWDKAILMYEQGLSKEVATEQERYHMERNLEKSKKSLK
jgi:hypothetical protein